MACDTRPPTGLQRAGWRAPPLLTHHRCPTPPHPHQAALAALAASPWLKPAASLADDAPAATDAAAAVSANPFAGISPLEIAILLSPALFYGLLTLYRTFVNPAAKAGRRGGSRAVRGWDRGTVSGCG